MPHTCKTADLGARATVLGAALTAGRRAWRAGEDVQTVLTGLGYARSVVEGVLSYLGTTGEPELTQASSQDSMASEASMGVRPKRQRTGARRSTIPVSKSVKKYVKKCFDRLVDDKYYSVAAADSTTATTGTVSSQGICYSIVQGTTDQNRIGNHIRIKELSFKGHWLDTVPNVGRMIVVWDKQPNGAHPAFTDILLAADYNSPYNHDNVIGCGGQRFNILWDQRVVIEPQITAQGNRKLFSGKIKLDKVVTYDASANAVTDLVTGNILFAYISGAATLDWAIYANVCYVDA